VGGHIRTSAVEVRFIADVREGVGGDQGWPVCLHRFAELLSA